ncbi:transglycosylase domain-containing protein [Clostridium sp. WILCCON 0269]|uniref:Penicillin-binding protein 1A n=1 Tax=Candidatus Clostridium eludens TaxID=3381663 RepID=A0ABW8SNE4_9CLOT
MTRKKSKINNLFRRLFSSVLILIVIFSGFIYYKYWPTVKYLYNDATIKVNNCSEYTFKDKSDYLNNTESLYLQSARIPNDVKNAFVAVEDKDFYKHGGVSIEAIFRAIYSFFANNGNITQGGSTITQQLARNVFLNFDKNYQRKLEEMFIAAKLEQKFTKDQILEFYVNIINFSNGAYGINSAAKKFFNKDCRQLNLSQLCLLAAIPNNPEYYDPINHLNNTLQRRDLILEKMKENKYITDEQYQNALNYKIVLNFGNK